MDLQSHIGLNKLQLRWKKSDGEPPVVLRRTVREDSFTFDWQKNCAVKYIQSYSIFYLFFENRKGSWQRIYDEHFLNPLLIDSAQHCERY